MKNKNKFLSTVALLFWGATVNAQVTTLGNNSLVSPPNPFLGWSGTGLSRPLDIRNNFNQPMNFFTNGNQRMTLSANGELGISTSNPDMPLTIFGGTNDVTTAGWRRGIHMLNHSVVSWSLSPTSPGIFMGMPNWPSDQSFYCGMASNLQATGVPNYVYRIINNPVAGFTSPNQGDVEFFHSINIYNNIGVGLNTGVTNILTPTNRIEINTTATTGGVAPTVIAPNGNSGALVANAGGGTGFSGLRLTDLRSTSTPYTINPGPGVLSLDANGDVIYVKGSQLGSINANNGTSLDPGNPNTAQLGQLLGQVGNPGQLLNDREIPMNNHNLYFTDNGSSVYGFNFVGIGTNTPDSKLDIRLNSSINTNNSRALRLENHASGVSAKGIEMVVDGTSNVKTGVSVNVDGSSNPSSSNEGVRANVTGGTTTNAITGMATNASNSNRGVIGVALSPPTPVTTTNYGVQADAYNSRFNYGSISTGYAGVGTSSNYGVYGNAFGTSAFANYGVFGTYTFVGSTPNNWAGYFNGNVFTTGQYFPSDLNLKVNIDSTSINGLQLISQIQPIKFEYGDYTQSNGLNLPQGSHLGFIAQNIEQILPNAVKDIIHPDKTDSLGNIITPGMTFKGVNYIEIIPIAIQGIKELNHKVDSIGAIATNSSTQTIDSLNTTIQSQQNQINDLNNRLTQLENCLGNLLPLLCQLNQSMIQTNNEDAQQQLRSLIRVDLNDNENIVLDQNVSNPFAESTIIGYSIPASVQKAQIHFYNLSGRLMKVVDITERGAGQLNVFGQDLSSGVYTYTLVADGRIIDTKKMVKEGY